jgi:hypothetical protein
MMRTLRAGLATLPMASCAAPTAAGLVFTAAEPFRGMGRTEAFLAFAQDGRPIDDGSGPFRLVVSTDGEASHCARNVERLTIVDVLSQSIRGPPRSGSDHAAWSSLPSRTTVADSDAGMCNRLSKWLWVHTTTSTGAWVPQSLS